MFKPDELSKFLHLRSNDRKLLEHRSLVGLDVGEARTKLLVVSGETVQEDEFPLYCDPDLEFLSWIGQRLAEKLAGAAPPSIVSNLESLELESLARRLDIPDVRCVHLEARLAPLFSVKNRDLLKQGKSTLVLDVGWKETRCHLVAGERNAEDLQLGPGKEIISRSFSAHQMIKSILLFMMEYGWIDDAERSVEDEDEYYQYAVTLLEERLGEGHVRIDPTAFGRSMDVYEKNSETVLNRLLDQPPWRSFKKEVLRKELRNLQRGNSFDALVISGSLCRLGPLYRRLEKEVPGNIPAAECLGGDPGFAGAVGMVAYGLLTEAVKDVPPAEEDLPEVQPKRTARPPRTARRKVVEPEPEVEAEEGDPTGHLDGQYFLRLADELVPIFSPERKLEEMTCAPFDAFLGRDGRAPLDLQVFWESEVDGGAMAEWPCFVARKAIHVPTGVTLNLQLDLRAKDGEDVLLIKVIAEGEELQETLHLSAEGRR